MKPGKIYTTNIAVKLSTVKHKGSKTCMGEKMTTSRGSPVRLTADFSSETLQARREWKDIVQVLKDGKIKNFQKNLKELQMMCKDVLYLEMENQNHHKLGKGRKNSSKVQMNSKQ